MPHYQGVIFDMDGVLCRTDRLHFEAFSIFAARHGLPFSEQFYQTLMGRGREECMRRLLKEKGKALSREELGALIKEKNDIFLSLASSLSEKDASLHAHETFAELRAMGVKLALGSSSQNASFVIGRLKLGPFFDAWVDGTNVADAKPAPDIFLLAAKGLGLPPSACLVVDDADAGVEAARRGGFDCAGIGPTGRDVRCRYHLKDLSDLIGIVREGKQDAAH